jgi:hypothetical protein
MHAHALLQLSATMIKGPNTTLSTAGARLYMGGLLPSKPFAASQARVKQRCAETRCAIQLMETLQCTRVHGCSSKPAHAAMAT